MKKYFRIFTATAAVFLLAGCYNDYGNPGPGKVYTDEDFTAAGLTYIPIREVKERFRTENPGIGDGAVASWQVSEPLYTRGKVISSDRTGNVYKSVYIYDEVSESAIELKLSTGNYLFHPVGQLVYVKLRDLVVGNYRGMLSIGTTSSDTSYSNDNIESAVMREDHIFRGEQLRMLPADTLVVTKDNYRTVLSDDDLGRLVRFEGVESKFGKAAWGYQNLFPNYFANSTSYDKTSPGWEDIDDWATWAAFRRVPVTDGEGFVDTYFFGSAWFTYGDLSGSFGQYTPGNYVVRTSGYSSFRDGKIPADGTVVDLTAIYTKFTNGSGGNVSYQLTLNSDRDVWVRK